MLEGWGGCRGRRMGIREGPGLGWGSQRKDTLKDRTPKEWGTLEGWGSLENGNSGGTAEGQEL